MERAHEPVLLSQVLESLAVRPGGQHVDGTVGAGGHAAAILERSVPDGRLLGLDRDPAALAITRRRLAPYGERAILVHASYADLAAVAAAHSFGPVDGILLDLGLSSMQLSDAARGFSFQTEGPLDMRFDPNARCSAADLVNELPEHELAQLFYRYGEEPQSRRLARAMVAARPIRTTRELSELVVRTLGHWKGRIHPATRVFQALRIAVNDELEALERVLPQMVTLLRSGGRMAVISFHSLEDRIVKDFIRRESRDCLCPPDLPQCVCGHRATLRSLTGKPLLADQTEVAANPRSRSARLRVAEKR